MQALGITALVGFLIGIVLSYLSSEQLQMFGADIFIVNILGISIIRELGPLLAAILVAGRSGSSMTAQLGVMRVTQELDALTVMGIQHSQRLIFPKIIGLGLAMPLLVLWTSAIALIGGMVAAEIQLGLSYHYFVHTLPESVPIGNLWLGLGKGAVCGMAIALIACHFGLRIRPNTESLGAGTTTSVVTSITIVIIIDAIFAIVFQMLVSSSNAMDDTPFIIEIEGLHTHLGQHVVHQNLDLRVKRGEILTLVGGSGSGKTTLLRQMLGLENRRTGASKFLEVHAIIVMLHPVKAFVTVPVYYFNKALCSAH